MAGALKIKTGTKMRIAFDVPVGKEPEFNLIATFKKSLDESAFLVSVPMKDGKPLALDETQKLLMRYGQDDDQVIVAGYADDLVKDGIRNYWKIRRVQEQRTFFKRADERIKVALRIEYMQDDWPLNYDGNISKEDAMTLDISGGGVAMFLNRVFDVGETVFITLPNLGSEKNGHVDELAAVVCWNREAPKGSVYRQVCGLQFRFGDDEEKKQLLEYIKYVRKRYRV